MTSWMKNAAFSLMVLPFAAKCNGGGGGGGGGSKSPSTDLGDWMTLRVADYLPSGTLETLHQLPVINWIV